MGAPLNLARPVIALHVKSGTPSSVAIVSNRSLSRSSSVVSTVMMGFRELISSRNSSCWRFGRWAAVDNELAADPVDIFWFDAGVFCVRWFGKAASLGLYQKIEQRNGRADGRPQVRLPKLATKKARVVSIVTCVP